jgi:proteic killer suppression protein
VASRSPLAFGATPADPTIFFFIHVFHPSITLGVINEKCYALCMIKSFKSEEAEKIFRGQFARKLPQDIQRVAARKLEQLHAATMLDTLRVPPGNRLEALTHDRQGQHSMRVNDQWRICFVWHDGDAHDVEIVDYH